MVFVVDSALKSRLAKVLSRHPVSLAYLYGSAASGKMTPLSDVDIALVVDESRVAPADRLRFELAVAGQVADRCGIRNADVRVINSAPLPFRGQVLTQGRLVYAASEGERVEFETSTLDQFFDFLPVDISLRESYFTYLLNGEKPMVDPRKLEGMIRNLKDSLGQLRKLAQTEQDAFVADDTRIAAAKYLLQISIEACLDIGNHLVASFNFPKPTDYRGVFDVLGKNGVVPVDFAETLKEMAGLRSRLVRLYWNVETEQLYSILKNDLGDFDTYVRHVLEFVKRQDGKAGE